MKETYYPGSQRINERLLEYWIHKKSDRAFPLEGDIDPEEIGEVWSSCFLVRSEPHLTHGFQYTYLGEALIEAYGDDFSNREVCERLVYPTSLPLVHKFEEVCKTKMPVTEESEFVNTKGMLIKFRSCMVPLGKENTHEVGFVLGGMKWKAF